MEGTERRARARTASKPARYLDALDADEPPPKRQKDAAKEVRQRPPVQIPTVIHAFSVTLSREQDSVALLASPPRRG